MINNYYRRLRDLREDHDYTQSEIAKILGISQPQYNLYEKGKRDIPTDILRKLCLLYKVSADYILELPKENNYPGNSPKNQFIIGHNENINNY